jgi:tellurite resistance protein TerC
MLLVKHEEVHPERNPLVRLARRFIRMTPNFHKDRFFVKENGHWVATPMFLVLIVVEGYDVVFAIDSIPAIFAITQDPFIVFTSNVFAILGLRSLYFVLAAMIARFRYLKVSLSVILAYVGVKLLCESVIHYYHLSSLMNWVSLGVIIGVMLVGILASAWVNEKNVRTVQE